MTRAHRPDADVRPRERGAALLLVLWIIVLLTGVITLFATTARTEGLQGRTLARATAARYAAEAGIDVAAFHLQGSDPRQRWLPDGRAQRFDFEGHRIEVRVVDESAKVDLNASPGEVLAGLFTALGVPADRARALSGAIQDWRDADNLVNGEGGAEDDDYAHAGLPYGAKDRPFDTVAELRQVLGMDAATFERAWPYLTVYTGQARPTPTFAAPPVLAALGMTPEEAAAVLQQRGLPGDTGVPGQGRAGGGDGAVEEGGDGGRLPQGPPPAPGQLATLAAQGTGTYSISSLATRADGTRVRIQSTLRLGAGGGSGQLYLPLSWRVGETD